MLSKCSMKTYPFRSTIYVLTMIELCPTRFYRAEVRPARANIPYAIGKSSSPGQAVPPPPVLPATHTGYQ